jgi:pyruvate dehydrogenase E1 component alpha subunit
MHLFDPEHKFSCSGIIGASMPPACGAALAAKKRGTDAVAVAFFGEGATNQGAFHESLNLAALWRLPVIFVCEDNKYAISVEKSESTSIAWNSDRAAAYGIPGVRVKHNDALEVFEAAGTAVARARRGEGPTLIEVKTDRYLGHFQGDPETYRPKGEVEALRKNDPIPKLGDHLRKLGVLNDALDQKLRAAVTERITEAYDFGRNSPYPKPEDALLHVFA